MVIRKYVDSTSGWTSGRYLIQYWLGECTWNGPEPHMNAFTLNSPLTDTSYSIDIEITNNDTNNSLSGIPNLQIVMNSTRFPLSNLCPDAFDYSNIDPEDSVTLTATIEPGSVSGQLFTFGIETTNLSGTENFSIRVISSDIFTGWMQQYSLNKIVKKYNSSTSKWGT